MNVGIKNSFLLYACIDNKTSFGGIAYENISFANSKEKKKRSIFELIQNNCSLYYSVFQIIIELFEYNFICDLFKYFSKRTTSKKKMYRFISNIDIHIP